LQAQLLAVPADRALRASERLDPYDRVGARPDERRLAASQIDDPRTLSVPNRHEGLPSRNRALDVRAPYAHAGRSMTQRSAGAKSDMHPPKFRAFCGRWPVSRKRGSEKGPNMICSPPMAIAPRSADELLRDVPVLRDLPAPDLHALAEGNEVRK